MTASREKVSPAHHDGPQSRSSSASGSRGADRRARVLVAGVGGASLGTEVVKCLRLAGRYEIFGCDISPLAYGLSEPDVRAAVVRPDRYIDDILQLCRTHHIDAIVPGGEQPMTLLCEAADRFADIRVAIAANDPQVVALCSNKSALFDRLAELAVPAPRTAWFDDAEDVGSLRDFPMPCVIKPATGSGGSRFVFLCESDQEARLYLRYVIHHAGRALVQEYIPMDEGEFTIGALSLPDRRTVSVVSMKRLFHTKLSVSIRTSFGLISSGYSQGLIDHFPGLDEAARDIVQSLGSTGPMNIQGRVRRGQLLPFEINPRFSASTFLRAMAGVNEIDLYLRHVLWNEPVEAPPMKPGYYLRSFTETSVCAEAAP